MTYISHIILCISIVHFFSFLAIILLQLLKHVKLVVFENYNECKRKHLFLFKKVVTDLRKKYRTALVKRIIYHCGKKTLSLRTLKRILPMRKLKRTLITVKTKDSAINEDHQELQDPQ